MRLRNGFVSNSSSCAFIITNLTDKPLRLVEFTKETPELVVKFIERYSWHEEDEYNQETMVASAKQRDEVLKPGENYVVFGDEDGTLVGQVYDYILRDGGSSKRFTWRFEEWLR